MREQKVKTKTEDVPDFIRESPLYQEFLAEREEVLKHKWLESEKVGRDIGFEQALLDWIVRHRGAWKKGRHAVNVASKAGTRN
jgi:hypothetical protein